MKIHKAPAKKKKKEKERKEKKSGARDSKGTKWVLYYMFFLLLKNSLSSTAESPENQYTLVLLLSPGFMLSLLALKNTACM